MKKLILLLVSLLVMSASGFSQNTLEFMGIPVDGTEEEMIKSLKKNGFYNDPTSGRLSGEFNGENVQIEIMTEKNKVWRLAVLYFFSTSEYYTIQTYNELFSQFYDNDNYIYLDGRKIAYDEDLRYNLKRDPDEYKASFFQRVERDSDTIAGHVWYTIILVDDDKFLIVLFYDNIYNASSE